MQRWQTRSGTHYINQTERNVTYGEHGSRFDLGCVISKKFKPLLQNAPHIFI